MRKLGGYDCPNDMYSTISEGFDFEVDRSIIKQAVISASYGSSKEALYKKLPRNKVDSLMKRINEFLCLEECLQKAQKSSENDCRTNFYGRPLWNAKVKEENVILNNFVQSTAVDVALSGFANIVSRLNKEKAKPLFIIHDALMIDVEEDYQNIFINDINKGYNCSELKYFPLSIEDINGKKY